MEVLWKKVTGILNRPLTAPIQFHDNIHGLRTCRGTGTAYLEYKLLLQLMAMREEVLYEIFLDLHKSYDALDRG